MRPDAQVHFREGFHLVDFASTIMRLDYLEACCLTLSVVPIDAQKKFEVLRQKAIVGFSTEFLQSVVGGERAPSA